MRKVRSNKDRRHLHLNEWLKWRYGNIIHVSITNHVVRQCLRQMLNIYFNAEVLKVRIETVFWEATGTPKDRRKDIIIFVYSLNCPLYEWILLTEFGNEQQDLTCKSVRKSIPDQITWMNFVAIPVGMSHEKVLSHSFTSFEISMFRKAQCDLSIKDKVEADETGFVYWRMILISGKWGDKWLAIAGWWRRSCPCILVCSSVRRPSRQTGRYACSSCVDSKEEILRRSAPNVVRARPCAISAPQPSRPD